MAQKDYYETLGVSRGSDTDQIRKAYRRLARKFHPDLNPGDRSAEERFKKVQEAYDILSDPKKRKMFDQDGFYAENAFQGGAGQQQGPGMGFGGFDFSDVFGRGEAAPPESGQGFSGNFRDLFSQFFGGGGAGARQQARPAERGADLEYSLNVDFWRAIKGTQVRLSVNRREVCGPCSGSGAGNGGQVICPQCNGAGKVTQSAGAMRFDLGCPRCGGTGRLRNACATCHGDGVVERIDSVEARIPPGVSAGDRLRVPGKGNAGTMGGPSGDLYVTVRVDPHPVFRREGDDILLQAPVSIWEAALGTKIEVPTIDGRALLKIPQGTQNGQRFRLREKGVFNARKDKRGDQIVEVVVQSVKAQDERTREILRELSRLHPEDPRAELWSQAEAS